MKKMQSWRQRHLYLGLKDKGSVTKYFVGHTNKTYKLSAVGTIMVLIFDTRQTILGGGCMVDFINPRM